MLILPYPHLWKDIERYCKILDKIVVLPLETVTEYCISPEMPLAREEYTQRKQDLEAYIVQLFDEVNSLSNFSTALFIFRTVMKNKMYEDNFTDWTPRFKICNYLFFLSIKHSWKFKRTIHVISDDSLTVKKIFSGGCTFFNNQLLFNEQHHTQHHASIDAFFQRVEQISSKDGDMHSYQITNDVLKGYLNAQKLTVEQIRKSALKKYKDHFLSREALEKNSSWQNMIRHDNLAHPNDDVIIVPMRIFCRYDEQFRSFISCFEAEKCKDPSDIESDLIFAYKTDDYMFISRKLLYDTQIAIENFITWGQYKNILQYFWNVPIDQKILKLYNRLMTYKIPDLLLANGYIVPMETAKGISIPRVEISNYTTDKKLAKKLGDIDSMFFSTYTKTLYLIEYKNYQMIVSRKGDLSAECSKVEREDTPAKVLKRHEYIAEHVADCMNTLFQIHCTAQNVKSIILTTKPCYYFFIQDSVGYDYMDWVEFERKVIGKEL